MNRFLILIICLILTSCSEEILTGSDYKEVTVVYALLEDEMPNNQNFVLIKRGFFSENESNISIAQNKDSLYFKDLDVRIDEISNGEVIQSFSLREVDLDTIIENKKEPGIFLQSPNIAYAFTADLNSLYTYKLTVKNNETGKVITGETNIISEQMDEFRFVSPDIPNTELRFYEYKNYSKFGWLSPVYAAIYDLDLLVYYREEKKQNASQQNNLVAKTTLMRNVQTSGNICRAQVLNAVYFTEIRGAIPVKKDWNRFIDSFNIVLTGVSQEVALSNNIAKAQGGITADQIKPIYTNLKGEDVYGLFSTRANLKLNDLKVSKTTKDSIQFGLYTKNLNIVEIRD